MCHLNYIDDNGEIEQIRGHHKIIATELTVSAICVLVPPAFPHILSIQLKSN